MSSPCVGSCTMARLRAALEDADAVVLAEEMAHLEELRSRLYREAQDAITSGTPGERVRHEVLMAIREVAGAISDEVYRYLAADAGRGGEEAPDAG